MLKKQAGLLAYGSSQDSCLPDCSVTYDSRVAASASLPALCCPRWSVAACSPITVTSSHRISTCFPFHRTRLAPARHLLPLTISQTFPFCNAQRARFVDESSVTGLDFPILREYDKEELRRTDTCRRGDKPHLAQSVEADKRICGDVTERIAQGWKRSGGEPESYHRGAQRRTSAGRRPVTNGYEWRATRAIRVEPWSNRFTPIRVVRGGAFFMWRRVKTACAQK